MILLCLGEINVYEAALTVHERAANVMNRAHLLSLLQGFDCSLLATPPTLAETRHTEKDRNSTFPITPGQKFRAQVIDFLLLRSVWKCHYMQGITEVSLNLTQQEGE